jgi:hypothetical protein
MKRPGIIGALAVVLLAAGCAFDGLTRDRFLSFDFTGTTVRVSSNGTENSLELKPYVAGSGNYEYTVLFSRRREGFTYLLINALSRSSVGSSGPCANGSEQNLIWLKLDGGFHLQDGKSVLVESCLQNIHGPQGYDRQENHLTMNFARTSVGGDGVNFGSRQFESALTYDNDHPEAGPVVDTHEVK